VRNRIVLRGRDQEIQTGTASLDVVQVGLRQLCFSKDTIDRAIAAF
jgi:hypothetical protein